MSQVNIFALLFVLAGSSVSQLAYSDETITEKGSATGKTMKRGVKKGWNRTKEVTCMDSDLECAQRKANNRLKESKDYAVDKVDEAQEKMD
jgi:hypothetical protein